MLLIFSQLVLLQHHTVPWARLVAMVLELYGGAAGWGVPAVRTQERHGTSSSVENWDVHFTDGAQSRVLEEVTGFRLKNLTPSS